MRPLGAPVLLPTHDLASIPEAHWAWACSCKGTVLATSSPFREWVKQRYPLVFEERQAYYTVFTYDVAVAEILTLREFLADAVFTHGDEPGVNVLFNYIWDAYSFMPVYPAIAEYRDFETRLAARNHAMAGRTYASESPEMLIDKDPDLYVSLVLNINSY